MEKADKPASFDAEGVTFSHWDFSYSAGWKTNAWVAISTVEAPNFHEAYKIFFSKLSRIIPRVALISQAYIEHLTEPFLIHKEGSDIAFFRCTKGTNGVGLLFREKEQKALSKLLDNQDIPQAFYFYWNDVVNTTGYSAKLLLMCSAIEALARKKGVDKYALRKEILGEELDTKIFAKTEGLRNRLAHGDYFSAKDSENYLDAIHKKIVAYFNAKIFSEELITENVKNPQRHIFGNKQELRIFVKVKDGSNTFSLKDLLQDYSDNRFAHPEKYESVWDDGLSSTY